MVYQIKKDYVDLSGKRRIYLIYPSEEGPEVIGDYDVFAEKFKWKQISKVDEDIFHWPV